MWRENKRRRAGPTTTEGDVNDSNQCSAGYLIEHLSNRITPGAPTGRMPLSTAVLYSEIYDGEYYAH